MSVTRRGFVKSLCVSSGSVLLGACNGGAAVSGGKEGEKSSWRPAYAELEDAGLLEERIESAFRLMDGCRLCPRNCGAERRSGETGFCRAGGRAVVHSHSPHFGEEHPLTGRGGSGTIFFSHCNLRCVFCQNWPIAHEGRGREISDDRLAEMMLYLQETGCHNINVVTPTHFMPNILAAVRKALHKGLRLPLCYNTGGYENREAIEMLDGVVDIYLPDVKYMDGSHADRYTIGGADGYPRYAREAVLEMHRQVGNLVVDGRGIARRGLMIRHLVMPNRVSGTRELVNWIAAELPRDTYVNIMSQYRVAHQAFEYPKIARAITADEFLEAMAWAEAAGLRNLDRRSLAQRDVFRRRR